MTYNHLNKAEIETLKTIVFEFCDAIDQRKNKDDTYKNKTWKDCLELRDKLLSKDTKLFAVIKRL